MKKLLSIASVLFVLLLCSGCGSYKYQFQKPISEIKSIEIVNADNSLNYTVIKTLSETEKADFLNKFNELTFSRVFGDPICVGGDAVKMTYQNDDYEIVCHYWSDYVYGKNVRRLGFSYCKETDEFNNLLKSFLE